MPLDRIDRKIVWRVFVLLWLTYASIGPGGLALSANSVSRIGYLISLLHDHCANIDKYVPYAVDKALSEGHYYLVKAPGLSLIALPWFLMVLAIGLFSDLSAGRIGVRAQVVG